MHCVKSVTWTLTAGIGLAITSCGENLVEPLSLPTNRGEGHTILIIDDGFDANHSVFSQKVTGLYTLDCSQSSEITGASFEVFKTNAIADLEAGNTGCTITSDLSLNRSSEFADIENHRDVWNNAIKQKSPESLSWRLGPETASNILRIISGYNEKSESTYTYHGTSTAGLIAYHSPHIKMVFLQMNLRGGTEPTGTMSSLCPNLTTMEWEAQLLEDDEFEAAFLAQPIATFEGLFETLIQKHEISLVNFSAGEYPYSIYVDALQELGCKFDKTDYLTLVRRRDSALYALERKRSQAATTPKYLFVQAAGNDGARIDSALDANDCNKTSSHHLLVGAYQQNDIMSTFSNNGECVDLYILGEDVVVAAPSDFLNVASGTSFAAPLLVRHISLAYPATTDPDAIVASLLNKRDTRRFLPQKTFPAEIASDNLKKTISSYALHANRHEYLKDVIRDYAIRHQLRRTWSSRFR